MSLMKNMLLLNDSKWMGKLSIHQSIHPCECSATCNHTHIYIYIQVRIIMYVYIYGYIYTVIYTRMRVYIYIYTHSYIDVIALHSVLTQSLGSLWKPSQSRQATGRPFLEEYGEADANRWGQSFQRWGFSVSNDSWIFLGFSFGQQRSSLEKFNPTTIPEMDHGPLTPLGIHRIES